MVRAVTERRSDRLDEISTENVKLDARWRKAVTENLRAAAEREAMEDAMAEQAKMVVDLLGMVGRYTVVLGDASRSLRTAVDDGSAPQSIGGSVIDDGDLFDAEHRGQAISIYSLAPLLGPVVGPIAGAWVAEKSTWHWVVRLCSCSAISFHFLTLMDIVLVDVHCGCRCPRIRCAPTRGGAPL